MRVLICAATAAVALAMGAASAEAAVRELTFSGLTSSGYDRTGEFGFAQPTFDLANRAISITFRFDDGAGQQVTTAHTQAIEGPGYGPGYGGPAFGLQTLVTFNDVTRDLSGDAVQRVSTSDAAANGTGVGQTFGYSTREDYAPFYFYPAVPDLVRQYVVQAWVYSSDTPASFASDASLTIGPSLIPSYAYVGISGHSYAGGVYEETQRAELYFTPTSVTLSSVGAAAVPEPGVWALMIMGFGGVGAALRNRRRALAAI
ncbi:PEPxxWA-CTERM sorting domain-containing protein [Phenylobacterium sp.]|uniref:PEPxxWA-CTERM sorting domain-containing protein n=1 Tax=Phenylobacterium sp. TaxID=1871053 RepID=UPI00356258D6